MVFSPSSESMQTGSKEVVNIDAILARYGNYLNVMARMQLHESLHSKVDPADLAQEAALLAVRDFEQFRGKTESEFVAWLRTILSNVCSATTRKYMSKNRDVFREHQCCDLNQSSLRLSRMFVDQHHSPSQSAVRREAAVVVANALASLPDECREVLVRRHLQDQSIVDIAKALGKSRHAIGRLLAKATVLLQSAMEEYRD